jgi:hypothetical protein
MSRSNFGFNVDQSDATCKQPSVHTAVPTKTHTPFLQHQLGFLARTDITRLSVLISNRSSTKAGVAMANSPVLLT